MNGSFTENFYKRYGTSFQSVDMGCKHITSGIVCGGKQCYFVTVCQTLEWRIYNLAFNNLNIKESFPEANVCSMNMKKKLYEIYKYRKTKGKHQLMVNGRPTYNLR